MTQTGSRTPPRRLAPAIAGAVLAGMALSAGALFLSGCAPRTLSLGFIGDLTGKQSELGVSGRNGALLRIEQANSSRDRRGPRISLVTEDDDNKPDDFRAAVDALVAQGIHAAIGPFTSAMAELASGEPKLFFLSPTASAESLSRRDDTFFRLVTPSTVGAKALGEKVLKVYGATSAAVLYDSDNEAYAKDFIASFRSSYEASGGRVLASESYSSSSKDLQFARILSRLLAKRPSTLLTVATGSDTALIIRRARQLMPDILPIASGWAATTDFLKYGGAAMDGTLFEQQFDPADRSPAYLDFALAYRARFGSEPSFSSMNSYEAAGVLIRALTGARKGAGSPEEIKRIILANPVVDGLQAEYRFDAYGDVIREDNIYVVHGNGYQVLQ